MKITAQPLTKEAFSAFGDVLSADGAPDRIINAGMCGRYHDRARLDFGPEGRAGVSVFKAIPRALPYTFDLLERHPEGSQTFVPMTADPFLVIVAPDEGGRPGTPLALVTRGDQAISFHRGTWHGVLTPLAEPGLFVVFDRIGATPNLEEVVLATPVTVVKAPEQP
ncbi:ureidoglycolate lyase [Paenirhodobacter sp.]|uniref:ureidoglycolate lyase n=1 Tax=Paenirhodobacter sp. TaxID=1965326 RepID=UPI003B41D5C0